MTIKTEFSTISITKMADNNESINIENTATESLVLNEPQANSTPVINNKLNQFDDRLNQFDDKFNDIKKEIKNQICHYDKRLSEIKRCV